MAAVAIKKIAEILCIEGCKDLSPDIEVILDKDHQELWTVSFYGFEINAGHNNTTFLMPLMADAEMMKEAFTKVEKFIEQIKSIEI
jgi:hypothetical protein